MSTATKPDCFKCIHRRRIPGNAHIRCNNLTAKVTGNPTGIARGWFTWPLDFDPVWIVTCDSFSNNPADAKQEAGLISLDQLLSITGG